MRIFSHPIILILSLAGFAISGCTDPCRNVDCGPNGTCVEGGACLCDTGYEGLDCLTLMKSKFAGDYTLSEVCFTTGSNTYDCTISDSTTDMLQLNFTNLYNRSIILFGTVKANGTEFLIPMQELNTDSISGSGSINAEGTRVTIDYTYYSTFFYDECHAVLNRL